MINTVIMAGGKGERFWPKSRAKYPKQLISLTEDGKSLIQLTVERMGRCSKHENMYVVTGADYASEISYQIPKVPTGNILVEPMGKNTAACIGLAAIHIVNKNPNGIMVVVPSDHLIKDNDKFIDIIKSGVEIATNNDYLITIGITPKYVETGYGYIKCSALWGEIKGNSAYAVEKFVEKPDKETAVKYLQSGQYLWNSGMFIWRASVILDNIQKLLPDLYEGLIRIKESIDSDDAEEVLVEEYSKFDSISIDYGIMEKSHSVLTIPGDFGWDDVGSWSALERIHDMDNYGNVVKGNVVNYETKGCIIEGREKLIATIGIEDLIIVDTDDATLICPKGKSQDIKALLQQIKKSKMENYL